MKLGESLEAPIFHNCQDIYDGYYTLSELYDYLNDEDSYNKLLVFRNNRILHDVICGEFYIPILWND